jgi:hypothetical protein
VYARAGAVAHATPAKRLYRGCHDGSAITLSLRPTYSGRAAFSRSSGAVRVSLGAPFILVMHDSYPSVASLALDCKLFACVESCSVLGPVRAFEPRARLDHQEQVRQAHAHPGAGATVSTQEYPVSTQYQGAPRAQTVQRAFRMDPCEHSEYPSVSPPSPPGPPCEHSEYPSVSPPSTDRAQAIPVCMLGRDCIGIAKTGSGKARARALRSARWPSAVIRRNPP